MENQEKEQRTNFFDSGNDRCNPRSISSEPELLSGTVFPGSKAEVFDRGSSYEQNVLICNTGKTPLYFYIAGFLASEIPPELWLLKPGKSLLWRKGDDNGACLFVYNPHKEQNGFFTVKPA